MNIGFLQSPGGPSKQFIINSNKTARFTGNGVIVKYVNVEDTFNSKSNNSIISTKKDNMLNQIINFLGRINTVKTKSTQNKVSSVISQAEKVNLNNFLNHIENKGLKYFIDHRLSNGPVLDRAPLLKHYQANFTPFLGYKIFDAHGHVDHKDHPGTFHDCKLSPEKINHATTIKDMSKGEYEVTNVLISSVTGIDTIDHKPGEKSLVTQLDANLDILQTCRENHKFVPLAICQPGHGSASEIDEILSNHNSPGDKFYGLKFHPYHVGIDASDAIYDPFLKVAKKHNLPCFFHSAPGTSDPEKIIDLAKRHPDVTVVLYHINLEGNPDYKEKMYNKGIDATKQAINNGFDNVHLEVSWAPLNKIMQAIKEVGPEHVIFGTDTPLGEMATTEGYLERIEEIVEAIKKEYNDDADRIIDLVFNKNIRNLINLPELS